MSEEQVATVDSGVDGGDSGNYANDAWDANYFSSHESELNPQPEETEEAKSPKVEPAKTQAEQPKSEEKKPDTQSQISRFDQAFSNDNGEIDIDRFLGFSLPESKDDSMPINLTTPVQPITQQAEWQKEQEEITQLSTTLNTELLNPFQKVADLMAQGVDAREALETVYAERKAIVDAHLAEVKQQKEFSRTQELEKKLLSKQQNEALQAQSRVNINEIASSLPGNSTQEKVELYHEVLFGKDAGAKVLDFYFKQAVPDNEKMDAATRNAAAIKFVDKLTSNKADLRFVFNQALNLLREKNMPKILQSQRMSAIAEHKQNNLAAQKRPLGTTQAKPPAASKSPWDGYFNSHYQAADRI